MQGLTNREIRIRWHALQLSKAKLKASSRTSGLLSGFAMVSMVELNIEPSVPYGIVMAFSVFATLLVSVHLLALMISTCILPNLEAISPTSVGEGQWVLSETPHQKMTWYIDLAWGFSTGLGIILFIIVLALQLWVKFWDRRPWTPGIGTIILAPVILLFVVFAVVFYRQLITYKYAQATHMMDMLDREMEAMNV